MDAALTLCRGGDRRRLEEIGRGWHHDIPEVEDLFRLELAGMRALTRITAVAGAKELVAERGALDVSVALLAAGYYDGSAADGAAGDGDVPFLETSAAAVTQRSGVTRSPAVREAAIVCLRNLSSCKPLMASIGRRALYLLLRVNLDRTRPQLERVHAAAVLHNIHKEPANRTRFYKAELRYKAAGTRPQTADTQADPLRNTSRRRPLSAAAAAGAGAGFGARASGLGMYLGGYGSDGCGSGGDGKKPRRLIMTHTLNS